MHQLRSNGGVSPFLVAPGSVGGLRPAGLDVGVNYAVVLHPCQMTPMTRRSIHPTPKQVH
jgi:hypothetical protein